MLDTQTNSEPTGLVQWFQWRELIVPWLYHGPTIVRFIRRDGSERRMHCTLNSDLMPREIADSYWESYQEKTRISNPNLQVVWDLEKRAWRSFRWDSVLEGRQND